jgi:hypothetical protein
MRSDPAVPEPLPPNVQAAMLRGNPVEAMRLLKECLQDAQDASLPSVRAAIARGDTEEATRLMRTALERSVGRPPGEGPRPPTPGADGPEQIVPGEVPTSRRTPLIVLTVVAISIALVLARWYGLA